MVYDPEKHHRRSIRLKGHDYAGGGTYFVTLCAHREFVRAAGGKPFEPMKELIEERMRITAEKSPGMQWGESVIMPDHFHALIRIRKGANLSLGNLIGGFKAAISREWRKRIKSEEGEEGEEGEAGGEGAAGRARTGGIYPAPLHPPLHPALDFRIWHRNYYEMIVRSAEAEEKIAEYIKMNPWKCVQNFGNGLRGIGNPALWNAEKLGVLCSRNAPHIGTLPDAAVYFGGWHSPKEKEILDWLLKKGKQIIACPAWGIERAASVRAISISPLQALQNNRMLILEMRNQEGDLAAAEQRNRFVIENADALFTPHVTPGGMLDRLLKEQKINNGRSK